MEEMPPRTNYQPDDRELLQQTRDLIIETATRTERIEKDIVELRMKVSDLASFRIQAMAIASTIGTALGVGVSVALTWLKSHFGNGGSH